VGRVKEEEVERAFVRVYLKTDIQQKLTN